MHVLVGSVHCWKRYSIDWSSTGAHAVTAGASQYIKQENLIAGRLELISILAFALAFHAITLEQSSFKENTFISVAR